MDELAAIIESEIRNRGPIPFARFMELALYCPVYGYYEKEGDIIGRGGDYYTSVSVGPLFGQLLACRFDACSSEAGSIAGGPDFRPGALKGPVFQILEAGAHHGDLARDILRWLRRYSPDIFPRLEYWIIEPSEIQRQRQQQTLADFVEHLRWAKEFPGVAPSPPGRSSLPAYRIIFANELLDALPVHRLAWDAKSRTWFEWGVDIRNDGFAWVRMPADREPERGAEFEPGPLPGSNSAIRSLHRLLEELQLSCKEPVMGSRGNRDPGHSLSVERLLQVLPDGFVFEISLAAERWWRAAADSLGEGKLVAIDYGRTVEGFLTPERTHGTLRAYRRHQMGDDLLACPGCQDITADVNFTALEKAGQAAGLETDFYVNQSKFLTDIAVGIWNGSSRFGPWTSDCSRQFQTLTRPEHLGRAFQVLVQSRRRTPSAAQVSNADRSS